MDSALLAIATLALGATLGLLSSLLLSVRQQRQTVVLRLLDQHFKVREQVVGAVSDLASIDTSQPLSSESLSAHRVVVARLFYQYYDFLPREVLDALLLLHVALLHPDGRLFMVRNGAILPRPKAEIPRFVEECNVYRNASIMAAIELGSTNPTVRSNQAIRLHARNVLYTLNRFTSLDSLLRMVRGFQKVSRGKRNS